MIYLGIADQQFTNSVNGRPPKFRFHCSIADELELTPLIPEELH